MKQVNQSRVRVAPSTLPNAGRGVFVQTEVKAGKVIERCPMLVLPAEQKEAFKQTVLRNYYFIWGETVAVALGYGSLYNHSYEPNATYRKLMDEDVVEFVALRDIASGEEVLVNYNYGNPDDKSTLWIEEIPASSDASG